MRSNVIQRYLHFIYNVRVTLQNEYYNIFASASHVESCVWCNYPYPNYRKSNSWE